MTAWYAGAFIPGIFINLYMFQATMGPSSGETTVYKIYSIVQSNTTIVNILFIGLGRHFSIPLESSSGPAIKIYRPFTWN